MLKFLFALFVILLASLVAVKIYKIDVAEFLSIEKKEPIVTKSKPPIKTVAMVEKVKPISIPIVHVNCDILNLRTGASTSSTIAAKLKRYQNLEVLQNVSHEWLQVKNQDGVQGYVHKDYVKPGKMVEKNGVYHLEK